MHIISLRLRNWYLIFWFFGFLMICIFLAACGNGPLLEVGSVKIHKILKNGSSNKVHELFERHGIDSPFVGIKPYAVVGATFRGGRQPDLAVAMWGNHGTDQVLGRESGSLGILLRGDQVPHEFVYGGEYDSGVSPVSIAAGDFNRDDILDIAVVNMNTEHFSGDGSIGDLAVFLGDGFGNFYKEWDSIGSPQPFPAGIGVEDFNQDGIDDIVVGNNTEKISGVTVYFFDREGNTEILHLETEGTISRSITTGDFNGDLIPDFAVAHGAGGQKEPSTTGITVFLGKGKGQFSSNYVVVEGISSTMMLTSGEFTSDNILDLVVAAEPDQLILLAGNAKGQFSEYERIKVMGFSGFNFQGIHTTDFNKDGLADLAFVENTQETSQITVLFGLGKGEFYPPFIIPAAYEGSAKMRFRNPTIVDLNSDGYPEVVVPADSIDFLTAYRENGEAALNRPDSKGKLFIFWNRIQEKMLFDVKGIDS